MSFSAFVDVVASVVVLMALASGVAAVLATRQWMLGLAVFLDLLLAAGLLHLATDPNLKRSLAVAAVVAVRHLVTWSLTHGSDTARDAGGELSVSAVSAGRGDGIQAAAEPTSAQGHDLLGRIASWFAPLPLHMRPLDDADTETDENGRDGEG